MLLDKPNAELLKLVALCKDFSCDFSFSGLFLFSDSNINRLLEEGLLTKSRDRSCYRASPAGYDLLTQMGFHFHADRFRENNKDALTRRCHAAQVMATLVLAGVNVFADSLTQLSDDHSYLPMSVIRRLQMKQSRNSTGNTRFIGLTNRFVFYYVTDPHSALHYGNEVKTFMSLRAGIGGSYTSPAGDGCPADGVRLAVVYAGKNYRSLCTAVTVPADGVRLADDVTTFRSAYDAFKMPVYLCPCDADGAIQLRVMHEPDYRARILKAAYARHAVKPPHPRFGDTNGTLNGGPLIVAVDMDLRRINAALSLARDTDQPLHILARECQNKALYALYQSENIRLYNLTDIVIQSAFGYSSLVCDPPKEPFITKEGAYIHEETIRACREARKGHRTKDKASSKEN